MFNQFTPSEVVTAVGKAAMNAARATSTDDDFARGQLLSAASTTRHLAVELDWFPAVLRLFAAKVREVVTPLFTPGEAGSSAAAALATADGFAEVGEHVSVVLVALRARDDAEATAARRELRHLMHELTEREVSLLAGVIESGRTAVKRL